MAGLAGILTDPVFKQISDNCELPEPHGAVGFDDLKTPSSLEPRIPADLKTALQVVLTMLAIRVKLLRLEITGCRERKTRGKIFVADLVISPVPGVWTGVDVPPYVLH